MASRVNVKFVVWLSIGLVLVFAGITGALIVLKFRSGDRYASLAAAAAAKGEIETADKFYERAVGKDPTNLAWLKGWREVRVRKVPATETAFISDYRMYAFGILRAIAQVQKTNVEAHRDYLQEAYLRLTTGGGTREGWDTLIADTEAALRYFEPEMPAPIRRYRGMAIATLMAAGADVDQERRKTGLADLEAVVKADPHDIIATSDLANWHRALALKARDNGDSATEKAELEKARGIVNDMVAANPGEPLALVLRFFQEAATAERSADAGKSQQEITRMRIQALESLRPPLHELHTALMSADPAKLDRLTLDRWSYLAIGLDNKAGPDLVISVLDRALQVTPDDPALLGLRAQMTAAKGDMEGAIAQDQKIADLPNLPVSWPGYLLWEVRKRAVFDQAIAALRLAFKAEGDSARQTAMARVKTFRQALALKYAQTAPELQIIDAKTLFAEGDLSGAQRLLVSFLRAPGEVPFREVSDARILLAQIGLNTGQLGLAKENLAQLPPTAEVLLALAELERQVQNPKGAEEYYRQVLALDPDNASAKKNIEIVRAVTGATNTKIDEPVMQRLADAERIARGDKDALGDDQKAIRLLEEGLAGSNYDARLISGIVNLRLATKDRDGAIKAVRDALAQRPDDENLKTLLKNVEAYGSLESAIALIDAMSAPDLDKWVGKIGAYEQYNKPDLAAKAAEEAAKIAPNDPRVLEYQFRAALGAGDLARAAAIAETAARTDADRAEGDTFKARLQVAQNKLREAAITLQHAVDRGNALPGVYRLLGIVQLQLPGHGPDGVASLRRAHELSPTDIEIVKVLVGALVRTERTKEALDIARECEAIGRRDTDFVNSWLALEAAAGNTQFARERREQLLTLSPTDTGNKGALAGLYIDEKVWDKSRALIDELKSADAVSTPVAGLEARWYAERGDLDKARQVFVDHIDALSNKLKPKPLPPDVYVVFSQFMFRYGRQRDGLAAMRLAEGLQDEKTMAVTVLLGDRLMSLNQFAEAEKSYRKVIAAGVPDADHAIRKRLIETLNQLQRYTDAEKEFAALGSAADDDVDLMCQHAVAARGLGDRARAAELLNRAVAKFPDEPGPYLERARMVMNDRAMVQDALADLATVLKLRPGSWQALHTRYSIDRAQGRLEEAIKDLRAAVDANPSVDRLRAELLDLLLENEREADAAEIADLAIKAHPNDLRVVIAAGDRFARAGRFQRAARYYKTAFDQVPGEATSLPYISALLAMSPPGLAEADAVLVHPALQVDKSADLLMARALLRSKQRRDDAARSDAADALSLIQTQSALLNWYASFRAIYPKPAEARTVLENVHARGTLEEWVAYMRARCTLEEPATREQGLAVLKDMLEPTHPTDLRVEICRAICALYTREDVHDWEKTIEYSQKGLSVAPEDAVFNNNLAYILCEEKKKPEEAMPYAERAARSAPDNDAIVDTLASIQWRMGQKDRAIQSELGALRLARTEADKARWALKVGRWKLEAGDRAGAAALADFVAGVIADSPSLAKEFAPQLETFNKDLQSAPK